MDMKIQNFTNGVVLIDHRIRRNATGLAAVQNVHSIINYAGIYEYISIMAHYP